MCGSLLFGNGSDNSCTPRLDEKLPSYLLHIFLLQGKGKGKDARPWHLEPEAWSMLVVRSC